jgi:geranylgeranyl reductase family protein
MEHRVNHDVIVVGAGPAGALAALRLSRAGARVLLMDAQPLGRDKPCGGGLTPRAWQDLEVHLDGLVVARTAAVDIRNGSTAPVSVDLGERPVLMVRRRDFDKRVATAAADAGADVHDGEAVTAAELAGGGVSVTSRKATYRASVLLIASGAEGMLGTALSLPPSAKNVAVALEVEAPARAPRLRADAFLFDYSVSGGYAWAFPKGDCWNVGVVTVRRDTGPRLRALLGAFVESVGIEFAYGERTLASARGRRIPLHDARRRHAAGRAALLGDAAGLADPFFGEGIAQALMSGRVAAETALGLLRGERSDLRDYDGALQRRLGVHQRRMRWVARLIYPAPRLGVRALSIAPARAVARRLATEAFRLESAA